MTDKKVPDNIIIGPWDSHGKVNDEQIHQIGSRENIKRH